MAQIFYHDITQVENGPIYFYHDSNQPYYTKWFDINCNLIILQEALCDINSDIRIVSTKTVLRDINSIIYVTDRILSDINCDIRVAEEYLKLYDIDSDIRANLEVLQDLNCDIRTISAGVTGVLDDIDCDIRICDGKIYDFNCDIRVIADPNVIEDINCDIRVRGAGDTEPSPVGLTGFRIYLNGVEIEDIERESIRYEWTMNETAASASFRIVRKSDNFNETIEGVAQAISTNLPIEIKFNGNLRWYGYVMSLDVEQSGESVIVNCLDRKQKIQEKLYNISYGRKWEYPTPGEHTITEGDYSSTNSAITKVLDDLVSDGVISSYSGVPSGIIPEYKDAKDEPAGTLLSELLDISGNFYWNVTPAGILEIYESGAGNITNLPLQTESNRIHLYDVINYDLHLNDRSNLITTIEVNMGTESVLDYASYAKATLQDIQLEKAWTSGEGEYMVRLKDVFTGSLRGIFAASFLDAHFIYKNVFREFNIPGWTDGSIIDNTFPIIITMPGIESFIKVSDPTWGDPGYNWEYKIKFHPDFDVGAGAFSVDSATGKITFDKAKVYVTQMTLEPSSNPVYGFDGVASIDRWQLIKPKITCRFFKRQEKQIAINPTIFDVTWIGNAGAGATRIATFSQLGIREAIAWREYIDGSLVYKSEPAYNDTNYATNRAELMLSRINDAITDGTINLTFDAFEYYGLKLGKRINLTQTNETDIYSSNNGFPLDINSIVFTAQNYQVSLNVTHYRNFKATVNYR